MQALRPAVGLSLRGYWITWGVLLVFTVVMLWADTASIPRLAFVVFMIAAMLTKASIIGANFMHLRHERVGIILTVVVGLLVTATVLFVLIAPDAARIHQMVNRYGPR
jgi:cytochrome c oxidase subunit IV